MRESRWFRFPAGFALLIAAGCGDATGVAEIAGTYRLATIEGSPLPFSHSFEHPAWGQCEISITDGSKVLRSGGSFTVTMWRDFNCDIDPQAPAEDTASGTFVRNGQNLTFHVAGDSYSGTIAGGTLDVDMDGTSMRFERE